MAFRVIERKSLLPEEVSSSVAGDQSLYDPPIRVVRRRHKREVAPKPKPSYPGKIAIRHAGEAARALGVDIGGIEVSPNGTIRVLDRGTMPTQPKDEFEEWLQAGKLA